LLIVLSLVGCSLLEQPGAGTEGSPQTSNLSTGTAIIRVATEPADQSGTFQFTGVPSGTLTIDSTLVVTDLEPGTYTTTEVDPAPNFDVTAVRCDDGDSTTVSRGDPQTRTAIFNVDPGETVTCTFTNTRRGTAVVVSEVEPEGVSGVFQFTGVPTGTIQAEGTLVAAELPPGTYTATEVDPAPRFDLVAVNCDDGDSATTSSGDPTTRSAIFNIDPGEMVTCVFRNARRGTLIVAAEVDSAESSGTFQYTGVPSGTISAGGTLIVTDLEPGTYTATEVDPAPDFELTEVTCDDGGSATLSSGDATTRSAIYNLDAGETVTCIFSHEVVTETGTPGFSTGGNGDGTDDPTDGVNPFDNPEEALTDFPLPDELPDDAGEYLVPKAGPWMVTNLSGQLNCGVTSLDIPASPPETGTLEVLDEGKTVVGSSLQEDQSVPITMSADPAVRGRYTGALDGVEQGIPVTINYVWQVVTEEYIVGYLSASFTSEGVTCKVYRPYELNYVGEE
jgi:peptidyl-tRNA hydrolase